MKKTKTQNKIKKITNLIDKENNYFIHLFETKKIIENFSFISLDQFFKKHKKSESCNDVFISDLLEYFTDAESTEVLGGIVDKIKKGKKLYIQGTDILNVCASFMNNQLTPTMFNMVIYGAGKKNMYTIGAIKSMLSIENLEITQIKHTNGINYYIECVKI